jgi:hypothetical protein
MTERLPGPLKGSRAGGESVKLIRGKRHQSELWQSISRYPKQGGVSIKGLPHDATMLSAHFELSVKPINPSIDARTLPAR